MALALRVVAILVISTVSCGSPLPPEYDVILRGQRTGQRWAWDQRRDSVDTLQEQLQELKEASVETPNPERRDDSKDGVRAAGQPEFTNEELQDELTEVRPLDIPEQLLEAVDDTTPLHYVTSTVRPPQGAEDENSDGDGSEEDEEQHDQPTTELPWSTRAGPPGWSEADSPQQLMNAVNPRADEDLLEIMVRIAENPAEWQRVHMQLQQLDQDLVSSRKKLQQVKDLGNVKRNDDDNRVPLTSQKSKQIKQQEEEKKRKKHKQKCKNNDTCIHVETGSVREKVKSEKSYARREELERAGVLAPSRKGKNKNKGEKLQSTKEPPKNKSKSRNTAKSRARNGSSVSNMTENRWRNNEYASREVTRSGTNQMTTIDSAIAFLSEPKQLSRMKTTEKSKTGSRAINHGDSSTRSSDISWQHTNLKNVLTPSKEERSNAKTIYYNGDSNYDGSSERWPNFSLDSLKHGGNEKQWPTLSVDDRGTKFPPNSSRADRDNWPNFRLGDSKWAKSSALDEAFAKHRDIMSNTWLHKSRPAGGRQWPRFAYHRVTSSPQMLAQQRAKHRNAYIAVSAVAPPAKAKSAERVAASNGSRPASPLPDKMDQLLAMRAEPVMVDPLEEQLIDTVARPMEVLPWSHARHLDRIEEQLKTLSAMEEKLRYHWLEKERLRQILRDGGRSGSGFFRSPRDGSTDLDQASLAITPSSATSTTL